MAKLNTNFSAELARDQIKIGYLYLDQKRWYWFIHTEKI